MKLAACLLLCVSIPALAQASAQSEADAKYAALMQSAKEAVSREQARSKVPDLCAKADPSNLGQGLCFQRELKTTDADETTLVRAIGAGLRKALADHHPPDAQHFDPNHLEFDAAEVAWHTYRDQTCNYAINMQWIGGHNYQTADPSCMLTLTWNHMNELVSVYKGLDPIYSW